MGNLFDTVDAMTGCLLGGTVIGQIMAVCVVIAIVLLVLYVAAHLLNSHLTAPVMVVGVVVGTGIAVYAVGTIFSVFEYDRGELHPQAARHARCVETSLPGQEVRLGTQRVSILMN